MNNFVRDFIYLNKHVDILRGAKFRHLDMKVTQFIWAFIALNTLHGDCTIYSPEDETVQSQLNLNFQTHNE